MGPIPHTYSDPVRRTSAATLSAAVSGLLTATLLASLPAPAGAEPDPSPGADLLGRVTDLLAGRPAQQQASPLGDGAGGPAETDHLTGALTRLRLGLPGLAAADRAEARRLLARPTDGASDPEQNGYSVPEAAPVCGPSFCVHYVTTTDDAPPLTDANGNGQPDQVETTLSLMESVLAYESGTLGFRPPAADGTKGGDARFDVYLSQIGDGGLYGYCAPEDRVQAKQYTGYCVLDNDFVEFPLGPAESLTVTAAHEFFHAIQFNYNARADLWLMEATATWVEDRFADDVNDNRQYIKASQLKRPTTPLDYFGYGESQQYGNWIFFERLSTLYGNDVVREVWDLVDTSPSGAGLYGTTAVAEVVGRNGMRFRDFYADFAAANLDAARLYEEGSAWPKPKIAKDVQLGRQHPTLRVDTELDHLTSASYVLRPGKALGNAWKVRLRFDLPDRSTGAAVAVRFHLEHGKVRSRTVKLDKHGNGTSAARFNRSQVRRVTVSLANASIRATRCNSGQPFTCEGGSKDDGRDFAFSATIRN